MEIQASEAVSAFVEGEESREAELKQHKKMIKAQLEKAEKIKAAAEEKLAATKTSPQQ